MKTVMVDALHPLRFEPIYKRLIWGGRRLETVLRKPIGEGSQYAESWEISDHRADVSRVVDGPLAGSTLRELIQTNGPDLFGTAVGPRCWRGWTTLPRPHASARRWARTCSAAAAPARS